MPDTNVPQLIQVSTAHAQSMSDLSRQCGVEIDSLGQALRSAEAKLDQQLGASRQQVERTSAAYEQAEADILKLEGQMVACLQELSASTNTLDGKLDEQLSKFRAASEQLADQADEFARGLQAAMARRKQELQAVRTLAGKNLELLRQQAAELERSLQALQDLVQKSMAQLQEALRGLQAQQKQLSKDVELQLGELSHRYQTSMAESSKQLESIRLQLDKDLRLSGDTLEQELVKKLAGQLQSAANGFSQNLTTFESDLEKLAGSLVGTHQNLRKNISEGIVPGIRDITGGLDKVLKNLNFT